MGLSNYLLLTYYQSIQMIMIVNFALNQIYTSSNAIIITIIIITIIIHDFTCIYYKVHLDIVNITVIIVITVDN